VWFRRQSKQGVESEAALEDAQRNLREVQRRGREVSSVANALKEIRETNHFAEALEAIMIRHGGPLDTRH
jgi:hypothetical protein